jgi:hypothetical protein
MLIGVRHRIHIDPFIPKHSDELLKNRIGFFLKAMETWVECE